MSESTDPYDKSLNAFETVIKTVYGFKEDEEPATCFNIFINIIKKADELKNNRTQYLKKVKLTKGRGKKDLIQKIADNNGLPSNTNTTYALIVPLINTYGKIFEVMDKVGDVGKGAQYDFFEDVGGTYKFNKTLGISKPLHVFANNKPIYEILHDMIEMLDVCNVPTDLNLITRDDNNWVLRRGFEVIHKDTGYMLVLPTKTCRVLIKEFKGLQISPTYVMLQSGLIEEIDKVIKKISNVDEPTNEPINEPINETETEKYKKDVLTLLNHETPINEPKMKLFYIIDNLPDYLFKGKGWGRGKRKMNEFKAHLKYKINDYFEGNKPKGIDANTARGLMNYFINYRIFNPNIMGNNPSFITCKFPDFSEYVNKRLLFPAMDKLVEQANNDNELAGIISDIKLQNKTKPGPYQTERDIKREWIEVLEPLAVYFTKNQTKQLTHEDIKRIADTLIFPVSENGMVMTLLIDLYDKHQSMTKPKPEPKPEPQPKPEIKPVKLSDEVKPADEDKILEDIINNIDIHESFDVFVDNVWRILGENKIDDDEAKYPILEFIERLDKEHQKGNVSNEEFESQAKVIVDVLNDINDSVLKDAIIAALERNKERYEYEPGFKEPINEAEINESLKRWNEREKTGKKRLTRDQMFDLLNKPETKKKMKKIVKRERKAIKASSDVVDKMDFNLDLLNTKSSKASSLKQMKITTTPKTSINVDEVVKDLNFGLKDLKPSINTKPLKNITPKSKTPKTPKISVSKKTDESITYNKKQTTATIKPPTYKAKITF